jgi:hypothetical protein
MNFKDAIKKLKIGASIIIADQYSEGDPMELVKNPNPDGHNKMITRKAARQWLEYNKPGAKPQSKSGGHSFTKQPYHSI